MSPESLAFIHQYVPARRPGLPVLLSCRARSENT